MSWDSPYAFVIDVAWRAFVFFWFWHTFAWLTKGPVWWIIGKSK